jgi:hypothetical protein
MKTIRYAFLSLLSLVFISVAAKAWAPTEFTVNGAQIQGTTTFKVTLMWIGNQPSDTSIRLQGFRVYRAPGATTNLADFDLIATVTEPLQGNWYRYIIEGMSAGTYSFYVRAFATGDVQSSPSAIKKVVLTLNGGGGDAFRIVTTPGTTVAVGGSYRYEARAEHTDSNARSHIRYRIVSGPSGMSINAETGVITWTAPSSSTVVEVKIAAYLDNDSTKVVYQSWSIKVGDGNSGGKDKPCAVIMGSAADTSGNAVSGYVTAYLVKGGNQGAVQMYKAKIENGRYVLNVMAGTYVLRITGESFNPQWWESGSEYADATQITVGCPDTLERNFRVTPLAAEQKFTFCGKVKDATTNQGIKALVYFYIKDAGIGDAIIVETDAEGNFCTQKISSRYRYIAMAKAVGDDYEAQYFNGVSSVTQATILTPTANRNDINFSLSKRQVYNNGFSGRMIDSAGNGVVGKVIAFRVVTRGNEQGVEKYKTVETDAQGYYTFTNLVLGYPNSRPFVPGYYVANNWAALKWGDGTRITVENSVLSSQFNIKLRVGDGKKGIIGIGGRVDGKGGIIYKADGSLQGGSIPLAGALVIALDNMGKVSDYTFSNVDGTYSLTELAAGATVVTADQPGYSYSTQTLNLTTTVVNVNNNIVLNAIVSEVSEEVSSDLVMNPNPAANTSTLHFSADRANSGVISIYNQLGREVAQYSIEVNQGENVVRLGVADLSQGSYVVR